MRVFIENEAGARIKNAYDQRTLVHLGAGEVSRAYPFPYGFVVGTRSGDGDCVDCFVLTAKAFKSGATVECAPIALLEQIEDGEVDHKVLAVPTGESFVLDEKTVGILKEFIAGVFAHVPGKRMQIGRLRDRSAAESYLDGCRSDAGSGLIA